MTALVKPRAGSALWGQRRQWDAKKEIHTHFLRVVSLQINNILFFCRACCSRFAAERHKRAFYSSPRQLYSLAVNLFPYVVFQAGGKPRQRREVEASLCWSSHGGCSLDRVFLCDYKVQAMHSLKINQCLNK